MVTTPTIESIEDFRRWLSDPEFSNSVNTVKGYSTDIKMFFIESEVKSFPIDELSGRAAAWLAWSRETRKLAAMTIRRRRASILAYGEYLGYTGPLLATYRAPSVQEPPPHPLPDLQDDLVKLLQVARNEEERALVACLGYEGMRMHEALSLPEASILLDAGAIKIIGKGDKERLVPITENAAPHLYPQIINARLINRYTLLTLHDRTARNIITMLGERSGIKHSISSHDLRATFATVVYRETLDIRLVQALLGHADIGTTQRYIGITFDDMKKAIGKI